MYTFEIPESPRPAICEDCGRDFLASSDTLCTECRSYREHPERAPGYFRWGRIAPKQWGAQARWKENSPLPEPGDVITVHKKDGTSSEHTVTTVHEPAYDRNLRLIVRCDVT